MNRNEPSEKPLAPRQSKAVALLLSGATGKATAQAVGVREATVSAWRKLPAFRRALSEGGARLVEARREATAALIDDSLRVVREAVASGDVSAALRVVLAPHLAAFAGGAEPGATRVEHSGGLDLPPLRVEWVGPPSPLLDSENPDSEAQGGP